MKNALLQLRKRYKMAIIGAVFTVWGGLVAAGLAPVDPFVAALRAVLLGFGIGV